MSVIIKGGANSNLANVDSNLSLQVAMFSGSPLPAGTNIIGALSAHQSTNVDQWNGTTVDTNSGNKSAGTLRVVLATDQPNLTSALNVSAVLTAGSAVIGHVICDSGSTTVVTGTVAVTESGSGRFATRAMLAQTLMLRRRLRSRPMPFSSALAPQLLIPPPSLMVSLWPR